MQGPACGLRSPVDLGLRYPMRVRDPQTWAHMDLGPTRVGRQNCGTRRDFGGAVFGPHKRVGLDLRAPWVFGACVTLQGRGTGLAVGSTNLETLVNLLAPGLGLTNLSAFIENPTGRRALWIDVPYGVGAHIPGILV